MCCAPSAVFRTQGVAAGGIDKGNALWSGQGGAFVFSVYPDSAQSQKGSMWPKGRLMCWIHPPFFFFLPVLLPPLGIWRSGIPQSEQRLIPTPPTHTSSNPEIGLVFHIGWYETFRGGLGETGRGGIVLGRWDWYWWRWQDGDVGIGRTDWSWERSEKLRQRWKSWRPARLRLKGFAALLHSNHPRAQRLLSDPAGARLRTSRPPAYRSAVF